MNKQFGLLGKKIGMTQVFNADGSRVGVTAIELGPCVVVQKREMDKDGYVAVQIGFDEMPDRNTTRPMAGHFKKAGVPAQRHVVEYRVSEEVAAKYEVGQSVTTEIFSKGDVVDVSGLSKGKGFAGVMKRYGFRGAKATHGVHEAFRHGGSLGQCMTPGRVMKGKKMPGHQGNKTITIQNMQIERVFIEDNMVFIRGPVPGSRNSIVSIAPAIKKV